MRIAHEMIVALRYKLRMFGVPIMGPQDEPEGPSIIFCDNAAVVINTSVPSSTLSKKHVSVNYHAIREAVAAGIILISKEDTRRINQICSQRRTTTESVWGSGESFIKSESFTGLPAPYKWWVKTGRLGTNIDILIDMWYAL